MANPFAYLKGSFDLGRVFLFEWTVNWRFLPEDVFVDPYFHILLLLVHVGLLGIFARPWWRLVQTDVVDSKFLFLVVVQVYEKFCHTPANWSSHRFAAFSAPFVHSKFHRDRSQPFAALSVLRVVFP